MFILKFYTAIILTLVPAAAFAAGECLLCSFPPMATPNAPDEKKACEDLFDAVCLDSSGKSKFADTAGNLVRSMRVKVAAARDRAAQDLGARNTTELIKKRLEAAGIKVNPYIEESVWKELTGDASSSGYAAGEKIFADIAECSQRRTQLTGESTYNIKDPARLMRMADARMEFVDKYKERSILLLKNDIMAFFNLNVASKCSSLESNPQSYTADENPQAAKICAGLGSLKRQAIDLFRDDGQPGADARAEKFVRDNWIPELKYHSSYQSSVQTGANPPVKPPAEQVAAKISDMQSSISCSTFNTATEAAGRKIITETLEQLAKSKTVVEALTDGFYGGEHDSQAHDIYNQARQRVMTYARQNIKDKGKLAEVLAQYDQMELQWPRNPPPEWYTPDKDGKLALDESKIPLSERDQWAAFFDGKLEMFGTVNAYYSPRVVIGAMELRERMVMLPSFVHLLDVNPYIFYVVLAHEIGHKIGPDVSNQGGHNLTEEYNDVLACFRDSKSIRMSDKQIDETMADYFSAEAFAAEVIKLPQDRRKAAIYSGMEIWCAFDQMGGANLSLENDHPDDTLRLGGIFGANPRIRALLGCKEDSTRFKTCGLKMPVKKPITPTPGVTSTDLGVSTGVSEKYEDDGTSLPTLDPTPGHGKRPHPKEGGQ